MTKTKQSQIIKFLILLGLLKNSGLVEKLDYNAKITDSCILIITNANSCRKRLFDKLVEECTENINEKELHSSEMIYNLTLNDYKKVCSSCTIYIALFVIFLIISTSISCVFIHFHWYFKKSSTNITNINPGTKTVIS